MWLHPGNQNSEDSHRLTRCAVPLWILRQARRLAACISELDSNDARFKDYVFGFALLPNLYDMGLRAVILR